MKGAPILIMAHTEMTAPTTFAIWNAEGSRPETWQHALQVIVAQAWEQAPERKALADRLETLLERLQEIDGCPWQEVEAICGDLEIAARDHATVMGWALAQTWPSRLEDLATWPERAACSGVSLP
jgi:hypothetical protein